MPVKFGKSQRKFIKGKGKTFEFTHDYMKHKTKDELFQQINKESGNKKLRRKCIIELQRRGVKIEWRKKVNEEVLFG